MAQLERKSVCLTGSEGKAQDGRVDEKRGNMKRAFMVAKSLQPLRSGPQPTQRATNIRAWADRQGRASRKVQKEQLKGHMMMRKGQKNASLTVDTGQDTTSCNRVRMTSSRTYDDGEGADKMQN